MVRLCNHKHTFPIINQFEKMSIPVTAVFDIGKTNKKFLLFDEEYNVVYENQTTLEENVDDDGYPCEDINKLNQWVLDTFNSAMSDEKYEIKDLNISAYGATVVNLNEKGQPVTPVYNYLKPYPEQLLDQFYSNYGGKDNFCVQTASPPMGMLNSGLQLYWLKYQKPEIYKKIAYTLHLPQYLSYLFTKELVTELTSIGCHTGLWDFQKDQYHSWLKKEKVDGLFPDPGDVTKTQPVDIDGQQIQVGKGIHDSSAALAPFLIAIESPFILLSTGTWSITLNPYNPEPLSFDELQKDCLCFKDINGNSVKASRFFSGGELEYQAKKLGDYFHKKPGYFKEIKMEVSQIKKIIEQPEKKRMLKLETAHGSGPFPEVHKQEWDITQFESYEEAYYQMMVDLVWIQVESLKLAMGNTSVNKLIVTGGFGKNELFMKMLATRFPDKEVYSVRLPQSSALGAATVVKKFNERNTKLLQGRINLQRYIPIAGLSLKDYQWSKK